MKITIYNNLFEQHWKKETFFDDSRNDSPPRRGPSVELLNSRVGAPLRWWCGQSPVWVSDSGRLCLTDKHTNAGGEDTQPPQSFPQRGAACLAFMENDNSRISARASSISHLFCQIKGGNWFLHMENTLLVCVCVVSFVSNYRRGPAEWLVCSFWVGRWSKLIATAFLCPEQIITLGMIS